jgi:hypothetical protein
MQSFGNIEIPEPFARHAPNSLSSDQKEGDKLEAETSVVAEFINGHKSPLGLFQAAADLGKDPACCTLGAAGNPYHVLGINDHSFR